MLATPTTGMLLRLSVILLALCLATGPVRADSTAGVVVPVPAGRIMEVAGTVLTTVDAPLKAFEARRKEPGADPNAVFKVVCDFTPGGLANRSDNFGACYELAEQLRGLQQRGVRTVAYVHGDVSRHSVMPVLACSEIVMSRLPVATLGPVAATDRPLKDVEKLQYEAIAKSRLLPLALIRKLYDRDVEILQAPKGVAGDAYRDARERPRPEGTPVEGLGVGTLASFTYDKARQFGLIQAEPRNTLEDVLHAYGLTQSVLRQTPANPVVCKTVLTGPVNGEMREKMQRRLKGARELKATLLLVELACGDGDIANARDIANQLSELASQDEPIFTIAYVKPQARNLATLLAFACDRIVMHPKANLGDFDGYLQANPNKQEDIRKALVEIAGKKHYPEVVAEGMVNRHLIIHRVEAVKGEGEKRFIDDATLKADKGARWARPETIKANDTQLLTLNAETAVRLGIAESQADSSDQIVERIGSGPGQVKSLDGDLLERIADFLRDPWTSYVLLMIAMIGLILEVKIPGVALPGVVSLVCFVLYFWSHSQFNGEIVWLALMLFVLGLALIALEIFVLPGFAVCGIVGVMCVLAALGLIGVGQIPRSMEDWTNFGNQLGYLLLGMFLAIVSAILIVRYLPHLPFVNQLMLHPAEGAEEGAEHSPLPQEEAQELLGAIGVAATPLRPSGKLQIGDRFLDVVAEGGYILPGTRVQIVEIEGNRIVVKEI
jgi:membrane-bound ClpP family serine protease